MIDFLSTILSNQGIYFVAGKEPNRFPHYACRSVDEMVLKAREIDS